MKHIVKVDRTNNAFRIVIPKSLIQEAGWYQGDYVYIYPGTEDTFIVKRFIDDQTFKAND